MVPMKKLSLTTRDLMTQALIAATYFGLTVVLSFMSYGDIQFRISEFMLILIFFNRKHSIGLILGTLLANLLSPLGIVDVFFGTLATTLVCAVLMHAKRPLAAMVWPGIINAVVIGLELYWILGLPLAMTMFTVFVGEFSVTFILSLFLLKPILRSKTLQRIFQ